MRIKKVKKLLKDDDLYLFHQGTNFRAFDFLGCHAYDDGQDKGFSFAVWAPKAKAVYLVGDFNNWQGRDFPLEKVGKTGIWGVVVLDIAIGTSYKYLIETENGVLLQKADPYAFEAELRPGTASKIADISGYHWQDQAWQEKKQQEHGRAKPINVYEVHLGSWKAHGFEKPYTYRELAAELPQYAAKMGYTHIEVMPLAEYPLDASWGYQATGYFAATSRYGKPQDLMYFIDVCHRHNVGVIMDWVPGHFCRDAHGLLKFDGSSCYEYTVPWRADNLEWGTANFDHGKPEVHSFLISNALFWFERYHIDGIRVDAVANMLYLDFGRKEGEWEKNIHGGRENLESVAFLRKLNETILMHQKEALLMAEESTEWPSISKPTYLGGLGFTHKWNMGWMNDNLKYMKLDPIYRKWHHNQITFSMMYAFSENFILPLSHDEVVHGKYSLIEKMPGDYWKKFANLRAFYGMMITHPGKKLLFMGGEIAQFIEWRFYEGLEWHLLEYEKHHQMQNYVQDLNALYKQEKSLWEIEDSWDGFYWLDCNNWEQSVLAFMRMGKKAEDFLVVVSNMTPIVREGYKLSVPGPGIYEEIMNSDSEKYGGSGVENVQIKTRAHDFEEGNYMIDVRIPPLATIVLKPLGIERKMPPKELVKSPQAEALERAREAFNKAEAELKKAQEEALKAEQKAN